MPSRPSIFARLQTGGRLKRNQSAVFQWFTQNHDEFAAVLAKISRPGWQSIADELTAEGLKMPDGSPLTGPYVRHAWWRSDRAYTKSRPPKPAAATTPEPKPTPPTPGQMPPAVVIIDDEPEEDFKLIRAGKPRAFTPEGF